MASPLWQRYYRFGPLESYWRSATNWKKQPMRSRRPDASTRAAEAVA